MTPEQIIAALLAAAEDPSPSPDGLQGEEEEEEADDRRKLARIAWVRKTVRRWRQAQRRMDDRCTEAVDRLSEEDLEQLIKAEQAKVNAIRAQLQAVVDRDHWPKELYWGGL